MTAVAVIDFETTGLPPTMGDRATEMAEMERADRPGDEPFACTMLLSRRLYPQAPNYRLGSLAAFHAQLVKLQACARKAVPRAIEQHLAAA